LIKTLLSQKQPSIKQELPVKKKTLITAALVSAFLFSAVAVTQSNFLAKANFVFPPSNPVITMKSPTNTTYNTNKLYLVVSFETYKTGYWGAPEEEALRQFTYTLDGKQPQLIRITNSSIGINPGTFVFFEGFAYLPELSEGLHTLNVRAVLDYSDLNIPHNNFPNWQEHYKFHTESNSTVFFRIDTFPQHISILMTENSTYNPTEVPLQFFIDEPASWMGYSLDGQENVTVAGNTTLAGLPVGVHNVTVYAWDAAGNVGFSETINFTITEPVTEPEPEPFPIILVASASVASMTVIGIVLLVYFKKRNR